MMKLKATLINGIAAGTKFADLPEDWVCPTCGADKGSFTKMD